ncbi:MAG: hypothetical protein A3K30_03210 [Deltaproteobacteria bacterium RBG_13_51_10]|nr:MAG: hypothetical protein A3K30_03210 [Deltaproteobacteria bacterium RBG_13_51_10]
MNSTAAKKLRKQIYGDQSLREPRKYSALTVIKKFFIKDEEGEKKEVQAPRRTAVSTGLRQEYRKAKKAWHRGVILK